MGDMADWLADNAAAMGEGDLDAWSDERGAPYPFRQVGRTMDDAMEEVDGVRCIAETPKAIRVMLPAPNRRTAGVKVWVPRSLLGEENEVSREGDHGKLVVARWFAEKEGLG